MEPCIPRAVPDKRQSTKQRQRDSKLFAPTVLAPACQNAPAHTPELSRRWIEFFSQGWPQSRKELPCRRAGSGRRGDVRMSVWAPEFVAAMPIHEAV